VKINKESLATFKQIANIPKKDMENYHWVMFTHAMNFFKECASLEKPILRHFFTSLLSDLLTEDLVTLKNLISIEFLKPQNNSMQVQASEPNCHDILKTKF
jgi:hypothetical protein